MGCQINDGRQQTLPQKEGVKTGYFRLPGKPSAEETSHTYFGVRTKSNQGIIRQIRLHGPADLSPHAFRPQYRAPVQTRSCMLQVR